MRDTKVKVVAYKIPKKKKERKRKEEGIILS